MTLTVQQTFDRNELNAAINQIISWFPEYSDEVNQKREQLIDEILATPTLQDIAEQKEFSNYSEDGLLLDSIKLPTNPCQQGIIKVSFNAIAFVFSLLGLKISFNDTIAKIIWYRISNLNLNQLLDAIQKFTEAKTAVQKATALLAILAELMALGIFKAIVIAIKDGMSAWGWIKLVASATALVTSWFVTGGAAFIVSAASSILSAVELIESTIQAVSACINNKCSLTSLQPYLE